MKKIRKSGKLVYGVGNNNADYPVCPIVGGKTENCPYYDRWNKMLRRCYSKLFHETGTSYKGCSVCEEWLTFSNFKSWMETQDWEGKDLDKDLLIKGNKVYSPETCIFIPSSINRALSISDKKDRSLPVGVIKASSNNYLSRICF